jgi:phage-related protein
MQIVGASVKEIRIHILGEWRVICVAKYHEAVYVLHAFQKKTKKTRKQEIDVARQRCKQIGG